MRQRIANTAVFPVNWRIRSVRREWIRILFVFLIKQSNGKVKLVISIVEGAKRIGNPRAGVDSFARVSL